MFVIFEAVDLASQPDVPGLNPTMHGLVSDCVVHNIYLGMIQLPRESNSKLLTHNAWKIITANRGS